MLKDNTLRSVFDIEIESVKVWLYKDIHKDI